MFRRKDEEVEGLFGSDAEAGAAQVEAAHDETATSSQAAPAAASSQATPASFGMSGATAARTNVAPPTANSFRPNATPAAPIPAAAGNRPATASSPAVASIAAAIEKTKGAKRVLTVGNDILLKGEIATCDRLVIDGKVDATLNDVHTVEISECGSFKGSAQIENAEIRGLFEGDLTVRGLLVIYATGKVRGKISYGEIEIERGGEFSGEIKMAGGVAGARPATKTKDDKVAA